MRWLPLPLAASALGLSLTAAVASWTLLVASYAADVDTLCNAEARSGLRLRSDMARVTQWTHAHLRTPNGGKLFARLRDEPLHDRAQDLRAQARASALDACPMAEAYDALDADGRYRSDLQRLCSRATFPDLAELEPDQRGQRLETWIDAEAATERARSIAQALRRSANATEQATWLRGAASEADLLSCDVARSLEATTPRACY